MCPFCISTLGLMVAGAVSTGGLATLGVKLSLKKNSSTEPISKPNERSRQDVN
jgi:hypothetical protein